MQMAGDSHIKVIATSVLVQVYSAKVKFVYNVFAISLADSLTNIFS